MLRGRSLFGRVGAVTPGRRQDAATQDQGRPAPSAGRGWLLGGEQRFRQIVESAQEGIWVIDPEGVTTFANQAVADMLACPLDELIGRSVFAFVAAWQHDVTTRRLRQRREGQTERSVRHYRRADGGDLWAHVAANPLHDADGTFVGSLAMLCDLTEQRRTEAALRESEERFRRTFQESPFGKALVTPDLRIADANHALCRSLGYRLDELVGEPLSKFTHPDDVDADLEQAAQLLRGDIDSYQLDKRWVRSDGSIMVGRLTANLFRDDRGEPHYGLGTVEDVTEKAAIARALADREARLRLAIEAAELVTWDYNPITGECDSSDHYYGLDEEIQKVVRQGVHDDNEAFWSLVHPDDVARLQPSALQAVAAPDGSFAVDFRFGPSHLPPRWLHARGRVVVDDGRVVRVTGVGIDFTAQRLAEQRRLDAELKYRRTIEASSDAFVAVDAELRITGLNAAGEAAFGWTEAELMGRSASALLPSGMLGTLCQEARELAHASAAGPRREVGPIETEAQRREGTAFPVEVSVVAIEAGGALSFHAFIRDITERKAVECALARMARTDSLTGLPNRSLLMDRLAELLRALPHRKKATGNKTTGDRSTRDESTGDRSTRDGAELGSELIAVVFIDLDRFKQVNDNLSHRAGDRYLVALAERIDRAMPAGATAGRLGGDEFLVIAGGLREEWQVWALAEQINRAIRAPLRIAGQELRPGASLGIAIACEARTTADGLVSEADLAMYHGKERGGGRVELFRPWMRERSQARMQLESDLRQAIELGHLDLRYQPIVAEDGTVAGLEALSRWYHRDRGSVPPEHFVQIAERTGLITGLGNDVLRRACREASVWRQHHPDVYVSVNLSSHQLADAELYEAITAVLADTGLPPSGLCLEITESALITDPDAAAAVLSRLVDLGIRIAVDDYGTGYSSLLYLRRFPVQILKLDRCFVAGLRDDNGPDRAILSSSIDLAHALGLQAIAEGVESVSQLDELVAMGCDLTQGFLWSKPLRAAEVIQFLGLRPPAGVRRTA